MNIKKMFFTLVLLGGGLAFAQEQITITTYYPAPFGIYRELRTDQMSVGSTYRAIALADGNMIVSGNVGIGISAPTSAKVEIRKDTPTLTQEGDYALRITESTADTGLLLGVSAGNDAAVIQSLDPGTSWTTRPLSLMPIGGNVGIGTTGPSTQFMVKGPSGSRHEIFFDQLTTQPNPNITIVNNGLNGRRWGLISSNEGGFDGKFRLHDYTASLTRLVVDSSGNVGITQTNPKLRLDIDTGNTGNGAIILTKAPTKPAFSVLPWDSQVYLSAGIYYQNNIWVQYSNDGYNQLFVLDPGGGARWYASSSGTGSWNLASDVQLWTDAGVWVGASSRRLKENFRRLDPEDILEKIDQLDISRWKFKSEDNSVTHIGPVAEDFYRIFHTGDSQEHLATIDSVGVSLAGVKALSARIKAQEHQIKGLKGENDAMEARIKNLEEKLKNL